MTWTRAGRGRLILLLLGCALVRSLGAEAPALARPTKYVTDLAGVFPPERAAALNEKLAAFERTSSTQILVYTAARVPEGTTMEELASRALRDWGVGQKGRSNGVIFFVFPTDRKMRIEVGYGLEGALPDARTHRITDEVVKPRFRAGDFPGGIEAGVDALLSAARGEPLAGNGRTAAEARRSPRSVSVRWLGILMIWVVLAVLIIRTSRKRRRLAIAPKAPGARFVPAGHIFSTPPSDSSFSSLSPSSDSSYSSSSSSDSSSSSSDFSGGGGDSGGGGSSDSW